MNYRIKLTFTSGAQIDFFVDVVGAEGYWRTDETGSFLEVSPVKGLVQVYPLSNIILAEITDVSA